MDSRAKVPVFVNTNLGTHIAIDVSPNTTAGYLKREIERAHVSCFPKVGEIRANGLMVKQKSFFYHLPDSLPIRHVFQGSKGTWFIDMEVCSRRVSDKSGLSECYGAEIRDQTHTSSNIIHALQPKNSVSNTNKSNLSCRQNRRGKTRIPYLRSVLQLAIGTIHLSKRKKRKRIKKNHFLHPTVKRFKEGHSFGNEGGDAVKRKLASMTGGEHTEAWKSSTLSDNTSEAFSETASVSGIIKKYFYDYEEVTLYSDYAARANQSQRREQVPTGTDDNCPEAKASTLPQFTPKTPLRRLRRSPLPADLCCKTSRNKFKRTEVGKRILVASSKLGICASMPQSGFYRHRNGKLLAPKSSSHVRSIVFEVSDNDE
ncbi:hypothetical protein Vadar_022451 [Vaccinium darrowii]|uniref:Uncharacterized protein n=1 Tax=Vaccinium darrowii TaxID=229202 RepID=A0ACB7XTN9_9ERIC|nr:hypothetical protein Vadar_022451 [Vaccinium darrowii]